jgi:glycosyltransferase involved in cell wall biosynthesis
LTLNLPLLRLHNPTGVGFADLRLAVVSPFVDRSHGTERCMVEQLERLATLPGAEIHLYSQRVEDLANIVRYPARASGCIVWHKVPRLPGPHLLGYLWWFLANHLQRWWDGHVRRLKFDLVYSPGINAFDADAISIHIVFAEFYRQVRPRLRLTQGPARLWLINLHRRLYYTLICWLERRIYPRSAVSLAAISTHSSDCLRQFFGRDDVVVIRYGVDTQTFHPAARVKRRESARAELGIRAIDFCILLIGNDWKSKGLDTLLLALAQCSELQFTLLVAGSGDPQTYEQQIRNLHLESKIRFLGSSPDVMRFYAAADVYVSPSLEDAYGLPILEAMACGLPVIASSRAGASEIIRDGCDGFVLHAPENAGELATLLRKIYLDVPLRVKVGEEAARTAAQHTWDRNAAATWEFLNAALARKIGSSIPSPPQPHR